MSHFVDVATGEHRSIYFTPDAGAWEIYGEIRDAWLDTGGETGPLGYPTGKEQDTRDRSARVQPFQMGSVVRRDGIVSVLLDGTVVDPVIGR